MYKERYGKELNPATCFGGHKSVFEMVKSMRDTVEVFHHEVLRLWVAKFREPVAPGEAVVVDEDEEGAEHETEDQEDTNGTGEGGNIVDETSVVTIDVIP